MSEMQLPAARPEEADAFRAAGKIAGKACKLGATMIHPGIRLEEVILEVEAFILSQGAGIGFPAQTSRNHVGPGSSSTGIGASPPSAAAPTSWKPSCSVKR